MAKQNNKEKLILGQKKEATEQMHFDPRDSSRPDPGIERRINQGETPYNTERMSPEDVQNIATRGYDLALDKYKKSRNVDVANLGPGMSGQFGRLYMGEMQNLLTLMNVEARHKEYLEELAKKLIMNQFKVIGEMVRKGQLILDFKITGEPIPVQGAKTEPQIQNKAEKAKEELKQKMVQDVAKEMAKEEIEQRTENIDPERAKRRLINAMIQGRSVEDVYLFNKIPNIIKAKIPEMPNIIDVYSKAIPVMMLGYWHMGDSMISGSAGAGGGVGQAAGKTSISTKGGGDEGEDGDQNMGGEEGQGNIPTIHAEAMLFPILIHEGVKGSMEFLSSYAQPEDPEVALKARELEDQVIYEAWDIRLGPIIWKMIQSSFTDDIQKLKKKRILQEYLFSTICNLPAKEFLLLVYLVYNDMKDGKDLLAAMAWDIERSLDEEVDDVSELVFPEKMNELVDKYREKTMDELLDELGITDED